MPKGKSLALYYLHCAAGNPVIEYDIKGPRYQVMANSSFSFSTLGPLANVASYHMLLFGTLLGTELYQVIILDRENVHRPLISQQSFVMTKVCYNALPMSAFTTLQKRVFPVYFRIQSFLLLSTALTIPPYGPVSLFTSLGDVIPLGIGGAMAALNLLVWGPRTLEAMVERIHQGGERERGDATG